MNFDTPSPPPPPNPYAVSGAQTNSNIGTALANTTLNNANQQTPWGNVNYTQSGNTTQITDPSTGQVWNIPQWNVSTTLSPQQQALFDQQQNVALKTGALANSQVDKLTGLLGNPFELPTPVVGGGQKLATDFGQTAGNIQYDVGPNDFSADRLRVEQAMFDRLNPQLQRDKAALESNLVNQGFQRGTDAFNEAMGEYGRNVNDARLGITARGLQEQQGLFGMDLARAGFNNAAQAQDYGQLLGRANFSNNALQNRFQNAIAGGNFANQAYLMSRNQPINEITALMSGSQVGMPQFSNYSGGTVAPTNVSGNVYNSAALDQQNYGQQMSAHNAMIGGLFGLGSAALTGGGMAMGGSAKPWWLS